MIQKWIIQNFQKDVTWWKELDPDIRRAKTVLRVFRTSWTRCGWWIEAKDYPVDDDWYLSNAVSTRLRHVALCCGQFRTFESMIPSSRGILFDMRMLRKEISKGNSLRKLSWRGFRMTRTQQDHMWSPKPFQTWFFRPERFFSLENPIFWFP